ncbi:MAG: prevent-host-death protein [Chloroflexota bacterium]
MTITISKSKLKANMLQIFRELEANGGEIIVTDHNNPVLRITPIKPKQDVDDVFSSWRDRVSYDKALLEASTIEEWDEA